MGATTYTIKASGRNINEIFNALSEEARHRYGYDSYNGTISTTTLGSDITNKISVDILRNKKKLIDFMNDWENDSVIYPIKGETTYINLGIDHYKAYTPTWNADKQTPKREKGVTTLQRFSYGIEGTSQRSRQYETLSEAKKDAKNYIKVMKQTITLYQHRSNGTKFIVGHFELTSDGKEYKSARKSQAKIYMPINEFILFVYAAC